MTAVSPGLANCVTMVQPKVAFGQLQMPVNWRCEEDWKEGYGKWLSGQIEHRSERSHGFRLSPVRIHNRQGRPEDI